ncbi:sugar lactone lactonase YvrE [Anaerotaenia torta]
MRYYCMKKLIRAVLALLTILVITGLPAHSASASQATSYTYTFDKKGNYTRTQDAYLPDRTITDLGLKSPEDLYIDQDNNLYIADSGNSRVLKYSIRTGQVTNELTWEGMSNPKGIFVSKKGDLYVADPSARKVFRFDSKFEFVEEFGRPDTPSFSDTRFEPMKVSVDNGGNLYIIGEGVYNGVIQLSPTGDFLGYFSVNKARLTFLQALQNMFFTRAQLANLVPRVPTTFSNVFIDVHNVVYTTTTGTNVDGLKKHNTAGGNIFKTQDWVSDEMTDVWVDPQGIIYTSSHTGYINIYSGEGKQIFSFGAYVLDIDVSGYFTRLPSIAVDQNRNLWTVDGDKGYLQSFTPTEYALTVYGAMGLYEKGQYKESMEVWNEVLRLNQMSILAHNGVGKAYLHSEEYPKAMEHFKVSGDRKYYSEAFWEVRNDWIQKRMPLLVAVIVLLYLTSRLTRIFDKKRRIRQARRRLKEKLFQVPMLGDTLYAFRIPRHPIDRYYDIRVKKQGTVAGATALYLLFFVIFMAYTTMKGFIYQYSEVEDLDINSIVIGFFALITLFVICNYLVTSIKDGDGSFAQVYMVPAYGCIPIMGAMLIITVASYALTYNEAFLLTLLLVVGTVWSIISIFIGLMTVHDYTFGETVVSLIITVLFMIVAAILALVIIIMWNQLWQFLQTVGKEMVRNVQS